MRLKTQRGQHTAEFGLLMGTAALVAVTMQPLARHAVSRGVRAVSNTVLGTELATSRIIATPDLIDLDRGQNQIRLDWSVPDGQSCVASSNPASSWNGGRGPSSTEPEVVSGLTDTTTFRLACDVPGGRATYQVTVTRGRLEVVAVQAMDQAGQAGLRHRTQVVDAISGHADGSDARTQFVTE